MLIHVIAITDCVISDDYTKYLLTACFQLQHAIWLYVI